MVQTRQSMVVARLAMSAGPPEAATGRHSTSAEKVTMAKTEQSMVAGRLTAFAGKVPMTAGKPPLAILRVTACVGKLAD